MSDLKQENCEELLEIQYPFVQIKDQLSFRYIFKYNHILTKEECQLFVALVFRWFSDLLLD